MTKDFYESLNQAYAGTLPVSRYPILLKELQVFIDEKVADEVFVSKTLEKIYGAANEALKKPNKASIDTEFESFLEQYQIHPGTHFVTAKDLTKLYNLTMGVDSTPYAVGRWVKALGFQKKLLGAKDGFEVCYLLSRPLTIDLELAQKLQDSYEVKHG